MKLSLKFLTNQSVIWHQKTKNHTALTLYLCQWCWSLAFGKYCFTLSVQIVVTAYTASLRNVIEHKGILDSDLLTPVTYKITLSSWTGGGGGNSRGTAPLISSLGTKWRWVVSNRHRSLQSQRHNHQYELKSTRPGRFGEWKVSCSSRESKPRLSSPQPETTDCAIAAHLFEV